MKSFLLRAEIGDLVEFSLSGYDKQGVLICRNGLGVTAFDLFNDILNESLDLRNFLQQLNITPKSSSFPGLVMG